jgi:hypothetical protein
MTLLLLIEGAHSSPRLGKPVNITMKITDLVEDGAWSQLTEDRACNLLQGVQVACTLLIFDYPSRKELL